MNLKKWVISLILILTITSCIQEEAPNAEADIETCTLPDNLLIREPVIENERVILIVRDGADITKLAPEFTITPGATISPASGTTLNFSEPQTYTVTSEDGNWKKVYEVSVKSFVIPSIFHFDEAVPYMQKGEIVYYNFRETYAPGRFMEWTNANAGFNYTGVKAAPDDYPTSPYPYGKVGACVKLTTKSTGSLGAILNMYIAAGNLFTGAFKIVIPEVVKATKFGLPYTHIPTSIKGYYKYKAGEEFSIAGQVVPDKKDIFDLYAVFYETDEEVNSLDGTNIFTSPNIISIARIGEAAKETDEWTEFNLPFVTKAGKKVNAQKLQEGGYNLAIVFASSIKGDLFEGAVGSTLYIDEVKLSYTDNVNE